jgi:regulatory protein
VSFGKRMRDGARPDRSAPRERRPPTPLDAARLEERALAYVARFATTRGKLTDYLKRKLAERGWSGEGEPPIAALVERLCAAGYVDDAAYARAKSGSLLRRGYGQRRVSQALGAAGIDAETRAELAPNERAAREAALAFARKRRFGAFDMVTADRARQQKQIAAMLRAGHSLDIVRALLNIASIAEAEAWAYVADELSDEDEDR